MLTDIVSRSIGTHDVIQKTNQRSLALRCQKCGFALVLTLSLLVLLLILAVGLLALSTTTLRSTSHGQAMAVARANARMALVLALGELQGECGPDRRITASAAILANDAKGRGADAAGFDPRSTSQDFANPHWMGSWDSWNTWLNGSQIENTYQKNTTTQVQEKKSKTKYTSPVEISVTPEKTTAPK